MDYRHLESWAERAVQELQELADELEESGSDASAVRVLIDKYESICQRRSIQASPTLEDLAKAQNVKPMENVQTLFGTWPRDKTENAPCDKDEADRIGQYIDDGEPAGRFASHVSVWSKMAVRKMLFDALRAHGVL